MIGAKLRSNELVIAESTLVSWGLTVQKGWTVTMWPDSFDTSATPLDFERGHYSAHDYYDFIGRRLRFVVVVTAVYDEQSRLLGLDEICGVEWRCGHGESRHIGEANLDELMPDELERKKLVENAIGLALQGGGR